MATLDSNAITAKINAGEVVLLNCNNQLIIINEVGDIPVSLNDCGFKEQSLSEFTINSAPTAGQSLVYNSTSNVLDWTAVEAKIVTLAAANLNVTTKTALYTVPTGKSFIPTKVVVRNASISLTTASFGFGFNANADDVIASATHTEITGSTLYTILIPKVGAIVGVAADVLGIKCSIAQGAAATATIDVFGYLF